MSLLFFNVYQLNVVNWAAKEFSAQTPEFFYRIGSVTA